MQYHQIPALFFSLSPRFKAQESVRITSSQLVSLRELVSVYCKTHDAPRLKKLIERIGRRVKNKADHHIWHTEFDYISQTLLKAMREVGYCRQNDSIETAIKVLNRNQFRTECAEQPLLLRQKRSTDKVVISQSIKSMFNRWLS